MSERFLTHRQLFAQTPGEFTQRVNDTLKELKEEKSMKKSIGGIILIAALLLGLCAAALAAATGGLDWFYKNVFSTPTLPKNVSELIQNDPPQTSEDPMLNLTLESAVWLPKDYDGNNPGERSLEILVSAVPKDPATYEVHPMDKLNGDGDRESRQEDFLETHKGVGPIAQVMTDPAKKLLLIGCFWDGIRLTPAKAPEIEIPISFFYQTEGEEQNVASYFSFHISDALLAQLKSYSDEKGSISLTYTDYSWVWSAVGDVTKESQKGTVTFTIKLPE